MRRAAVLALAILIAGAGVALAQHPANERGFKPESVYQFNGFDTVNLFNGNLILTVPLGPSYPVGPALSYSFVLRYSANVWENREFERIAWSHEPEPGMVFTPHRDNGALGWRLSFGELEAPTTTEPTLVPSMWKYRTPDGSDHYFYDTLHEPKCTSTLTTNCDPVETQPGNAARYTRDGSYLRLRETAPDVRVVEFPNGERQRFELSSGKWKLRYIYNTLSALGPGGVPTSNYVQFEYTPRSWTPPPGQGPVRTWDDWKITDSHGRQHNVQFGAPVEPSGREHLVKLAIPAFQGGTAEYLFETQSVAIQQPCGGSEGNNNRDSMVALLTRIALPSGEDFLFTYNTPPKGPCAMASGLIASARLPTLAAINWTWQQYGYSLTDFPATGVKERTVTYGSAVLERTEYETSLGRTTVTVCGAMSGTTCRADFKTVHHYVHAYDDPAFGLPFTRSARPASDPVRNPDGSAQSRFVSIETIDCNPSAGTCEAVPKRAAYVKYEMDAPGACPAHHPCFRDRNRRVVSERTLFVDDGGKVADTDSSDFDGLGHYRKVTATGFTAGPSPRETFTNYNANLRNFANWSGDSAGTYRLNADGSRAPGFTMPSRSDPWVLGTYTGTTVTENGSSVVSQACFDVTTGFLHRRRLLKGPVAGASDLLTIFTKDAATGFVASEHAFGGDWHNLGTGDLCTMPQPAHTESTFRIDHGYSGGVLTTSRYIRPDDTAMPFYSLNSTVDAHSGLVKTTADTSELKTAFEYDKAGRLTAVRPPGAAVTVYSYGKAEGTSPATVTATTGTGASSIGIEYQYDPLGRLWRERRLMPDGTWSARETTYDMAGRKSSVSEQETMTGTTFTPSHKTTFASYDPFGRAGTVTAPDGSTTTWTHTGSRLVTRTARGGGIAPIFTTTSEEYDRHGRLLSVTENSGPAGQAVTTAYTYDPAGRLSGVRMSGAENMVQSRTFDYDGRGFLRWESQPESGMRSYSYDARGHVRTVEMGAARTMFDLRYTYDAAERLTAVDGRVPTAPDTYRPFKVFTYADSNDSPTAPTDYRMGKLWKATRYNYPPGAPVAGTSHSYMSGDIVRVTETYGYRDAAGRRTHRTTGISASIDLTCCWHDLQSIEQSVQYDDHGQPQVVSYPICRNCGMPDTFPPRDVQAAYAAGRLTSLKHRVTADGGFADVLKSVTYWPNGMRHVVAHSNDVADTQTVHPGGMARPGTLLSEKYDTCTGPSVVQQTTAATASSSQPATLSVTVAGTAPLSYQWYNADTFQPIAGATGSTYVASPATKTRYFVEARNRCSFVRSKYITVEPGECVQPWIAEAKATRNADGTQTLTASAGGTGTLTYTWSRTSDDVVLGTGATVVTPVLTVPTEYRVSVTNACGGQSASQAVVASVPLAPSSVSASRSAASQVTVSWSAVAGATRYEVERRGPGTGWTVIATVFPPQNSFIDGGLSLDSVYLYRVTAGSAGDASVTSAADPATTLTFTNISLFRISASHFDELLRAVNAARAVVGWPGVTWSSILAPSDPVPAPGGIVLARHVTSLRARMNEALQAGGVPAGGYTDSDPQLKTIRGEHIIQLQNRVQ